MSGLILKLRPHEELLINGVIIRNGDRKARLRVMTDGASILRLRDAMRPEEATTPERKAYYIAQMAVAGELSETEARPLLAAAIVRLAEGRQRGDGSTALAAAAEELSAGRFYAVMRRLGALIERGADEARPSVVVERRQRRKPRAARA